jgi:hypothetical protein
VLSPVLLTRWTREAFTAARAGDTVTAAETADLITEHGDAFDLIASCRVMADAALRALLVLYGAPDPARGEAWVLDELSDIEDRPELLFTVRLVTAYANHDSEHVTALVATAARASRTERAESLRSLVTYAAQLDARAAQHGSPTEGTTDDH